MKVRIAVMVLAMVGALGFTQGVGGASGRLVEMRITLPGGATPQLTVREGETASLKLNDAGSFGFRPVFEQGSESNITVTIFDLAVTPAHEIGSVHVVLRESGVRSRTTPAFTIQVTGIRTGE